MVQERDMGAIIDGMGGIQTEHEKNREREQVRGYVKALDKVGNLFDEYSQLTPEDDFGVVLQAVRDFEGVIKDSLAACHFALNNRELKAQMDHDLGNILSGAQLGLAVMAEPASPRLTEDMMKEAFFDTQVVWDRFYVAFKDMLFKFLSKEGIDSEIEINGVDLGVMQRVFEYFQKKELDDIKKSTQMNKEYGEDAPYEGIEERTFVSKIDWDKLRQDIGDRMIMGDTSIVANGELNVKRNPLKARLEVPGEHTKVTEEMFVEGNNLVVRIEDTGKGMDFEHLNPDDPEHFAFFRGNSGSDSTGLGLADMHTRLAALGIELKVFSKRVSNNGDNKLYVYYDNGVGHSDSSMIFVQGQDAEGLAPPNTIGAHGTVFEMRLPLVDKPHI